MIKKNSSWLMVVSQIWGGGEALYCQRVTGVLLFKNIPTFEEILFFIIIVESQNEKCLSHEKETHQWVYIYLFSNRLQLCIDNSSTNFLRVPFLAPIYSHTRAPRNYFIDHLCKRWTFFAYFLLHCEIRNSRKKIHQNICTHIWNR